MKVNKKIASIFGWTLSVGVSGILCEPIKFLLSKIKWSNFLDPNNFHWLVENRYTFQISIIDILIFIILLTCTSLILRSLRNKIQKHSKDEKVRQLKCFNHLEEGDLKATWSVYTSGYMSRNPFIADLTLYCKKHPIPLKMNHGLCTDPNCPYYFKGYDEYQIKNHIESMLALKKEELGL